MTVLNDVNGDALTTDDASGAIVTLERAHHEVHEGDHYHAADVAAAITTQDYLVVTPAGPKHMHMIITLVTSSGLITLAVYRNPTATASATKILAINSNHESSNTSVSDISKTPTGITTGSDVVWQDLAGSGPTGGGPASRADAEIVLKASTKYLFRFTGTGNPTLLARWTWYEEPV